MRTKTRGPYFNVIYKVTHRKTGLAYIGRTTSMFNRAWDHLYASAPRGKSLLNDAIRREGRDVFIIQIIEFCDDADPGEREAFWVEKFGTLHPNGYNLSGGGYGVGQGARSEELDRRLRKAIDRRTADPEWQKRNAEHWRALWQTEEHRAKHKAAMGFQSDPEIRRKVSETQKKNWQNPEYRERALQALAESKDEEWSRKQSEAKQRLWRDPEYRDKMLDAFEHRPPLTSERRAQVSEQSREMWADPEFKRKMSLTHKQSWESQERRDKMSERMNKQCQQPEYLALLSEKSREMWADPEFKRKMCKLTDDQVRDVRRRLAAGEKRQSIAERFGVSRGTINNIWRGRSYIWVA